MVVTAAKKFGDIWISVALECFLRKTLLSVEISVIRCLATCSAVSRVLCRIRHTELIRHLSVIDSHCED